LSFYGRRKIMHRPRRRVILVALLALCCQRESPHAPAPVATASASPSAPLTAKLPGLDGPAARPARRQIIRNADLAVEDDDPARAQQRAIALVEKLGGFALSTDAQKSGRERGSGELRIDMVLRVPADRFETALAALRSLGRGAEREQVTGQDVTEEFIDLEARIRTERALESQLLDILRSTRSVSEMMEVHGRLADVRGEIEKMEGRRRFLDDQTTLSTIRLAISGPASREGPRFGETVRRATGDLVAVSSAIVTGGIRLGGVLLPVFVMIVLPATALTRAVLRRRRARAARPG
jgi:hypothetical protein